MEKKTWLIIGIGNELAGDDALGRQVVESLAKKALPGVQILSLPQLTPEMTEHLRYYERVIFVDADVSGREVALRPLASEGIRQPFSHLWSPQAILALLEMTTGSVPQAWLATLPARDLDFGKSRNEFGAELVAEAVRLIEVLIESQTATPRHLDEATRTVGSGTSK